MHQQKGSTVVAFYLVLWQVLISCLVSVEIANIIIGLDILFFLNRSAQVVHFIQKYINLLHKQSSFRRLAGQRKTVTHLASFSLLLASLMLTAVLLVQ